MQIHSQGYRNHEKNQENTSLPKEYSKPPTTAPREIELKEVFNKEFRIIILQMLRKLQENTDKQFNDVRETVQEQKEKFNQEIENIKK